MKRRGKKLELTRREKLSLLWIPVLIFGIDASAFLLHREHMIDPTEVVSISPGQDAAVPLSRLDRQPSLYLDFEGLPEPHRLLVVRREGGRIEAVFSVCRRCWSYGKPSRYLAGRLVCGHCREGMPMLGPGQQLPKEKDCTPIPVAALTVEGVLRVGLGDVLRTAEEFRRGE